jgi:hypothetical protein
MVLLVKLASHQPGMGPGVLAPLLQERRRVVPDRLSALLFLQGDRDRLQVTLDI